MHTFMDAKLMAKLLRKALAERSIELSHSDCLELVARQFGVSDWNILSARIEANTEPSLSLPQGWMRSGSKPRLYRSGLDPATGNALIESRLDSGTISASDFCTLMQSIAAAPYIGKRIRLTGEIRTENAADGGTIFMRIDGETATSLRFDNLNTRETDGAVTGTSDWQTRNIVFDVPEEAVSVHFGFFLAGNGRCWARQFTLETVDSSVPTSIRQLRYLREPTNLDFRSSQPN
ncbi:hypothetical protein GCM10007913_17760 [Devosia yakushimensis]|uniref:Glyoxalase-related protein domain-containing protein n=1 Tax=Devosia yakushimensis TaxID=470028 RepID=A0ABQ5UCM5_9HYPH|nr:glyoxalase superfamily protein [Devosia yakushimensis]GLQ09844.1 hypothetical protein GCM10007913_17760 [Devosia yakushimensis]